MTTEQIIKALECCFINQNCNGCSMYNGIKPQKDCLEIACKNALALIKELQAHNENLKKENKYLRESLADEREHKKDMEGGDTE